MIFFLFFVCWLHILFIYYFIWFCVIFNQQFCDTHLKWEIQESRYEKWNILQSNKKKTLVNGQLYRVATYFDASITTRKKTTKKNWKRITQHLIAQIFLHNVILLRTNLITTLIRDTVKIVFVQIPKKK